MTGIADTEFEAKRSHLASCLARRWDLPNNATLIAALPGLPLYLLARVGSGTFVHAVGEATIGLAAVWLLFAGLAELEIHKAERAVREHNPPAG